MLITVRSLLNIGIAYPLPDKKIDFPGKHSIEARNNKTESFYCDTLVSQEDWDYICEYWKSTPAILNKSLYQVSPISKVSKSEKDDMKIRTDLEGITTHKTPKSKKV